MGQIKSAGAGHTEPSPSVGKFLLTGRLNIKKALYIIIEALKSKKRKRWEEVALYFMSIAKRYVSLGAIGRA